MKKYLNKIIKYSTYLLIFLLPLQTRWIIEAGVFNGGYFEYGTISLYLIDVLLILLLLLFFATSLRGAKATKQSHDQCTMDRDCFVVTAPRNDKIVWVLIATIELFIFFSCFRSPDKIIAFYTYGRFLLGVGLFYLITIPPLKGVPGREGVVTLNQFIFLFLAGTFLQSILAIYQVITQSTFANKFFGLAEHLPETLGTSVVELADGTRWLRAYGGLDHPNMLGGLMVFAIMLALIELIKLDNNYPFEGGAPSGWGLLRQINTSKIKITLLLFSLIISTITLFFTFSRSAWLATIAGIVSLLFFAVIRKYLIMQKRILYVIILISSISFVLFLSFNNLVATRVAANARLEQKSSIERLEANQKAVEIIKDNWLWGVGIGNYTHYLQQQEPGRDAYTYQPVHNIILLVAAEIGVVALFIFIFLILYIFFNHMIYHVINHVNGFLLIPVLILFLFDHWLWSLHFGVILFWFIMGLACLVEGRRLKK